MFIMTLKEIENWSHRVFNYLNGFVNPSFKVGSLKITVFGTDHARYVNATNPHMSYIAINPRLIEQTFKPEYIPRIIVDIMIHELTHAEQKLNWRSYSNDVDYKDKIEANAVKRTYEFVQRNKERLEKDLHIEVIEGPLSIDCFKDNVMNEILEDIKRKNKD